MDDTATCISFPRVKEVRAYTKKASSDQGAWRLSVILRLFIAGARNTQMALSLL